MSTKGEETEDSTRTTFRSDPVLKQRVEQAVKKHGYMGSSEFVREAVRTHLRRVNGRERP